MAVSPIGLANRVVSAEALDAEVATLTTLIASKSPAALAQNKSADPAADSASDSKNRIFGFLDNYTTVEGSGKIKPITTAESFKMAALESFDPFVYRCLDS
jgi:hypothetical protein